MRTPDLTIWCADGEPLEGCSYATRIADRLGAVVGRMSVVPLSERAPDPSELAAPLHVLTGGATSADSPLPWMVAVRDRLGELLRTDARVVGICLGSQLLALSLGGACGPSRSGLEIGLVDVAERSGSEGTLAVAQFHYHEIGASVLRHPEVVHRFSNEHSLVQGFDHGDRHRALQFHPEFTPDDASELVARHPELLAEHSLDAGTVSRRSEALAEGWSPETFDRLVTRFLIDS